MRDDDENRKKRKRKKRWMFKKTLSKVKVKEKRVWRKQNVVAKDKLLPFRVLHAGCARLWAVMIG